MRRCKCKLCGDLLDGREDSNLCDQCLELKSRIEHDLDLAKKIIKNIEIESFKKSEEKYQKRIPLTLQKLIDMKSNKMFATGTVSDNQTGINMTNSGNLLRWVAVRGYIYDWAIYIYWADKNVDFIRKQGDKVTGEDNIKKLVPCDDESFKMYRM